MSLSALGYYILQFIIGGGSVVGIGLIAKYIDPKYSGILYALPIISVVAMIFVYIDQGLATSQRTLKSILVYEFSIIYFLGAFYLLIQRVNFWWALSIAWITWACLAALINYWFKG